MTNPYNHSGYTDSEEVAREKEWGLKDWTHAQCNHLMSEEVVAWRIRQRAKIRAAKRIVGVTLVVGALLLIRYWYLNYGWNLF